MMRQTVAFAISMAFALGGAGYFYFQYVSSQKTLADLNGQFSQLKDEKNEVATELAVLKATDLTKEVEVLGLKLKTAERDFAEKEKELAAALQEKAGLTVQLQTARTNSAKIRTRLDAIDVIERMVGAGPNAQSVMVADAKIAAAKDADIAGAWAIAKRDIDFTRMSWNGNTIADAVTAITRSIRNLLP